MNQGEMSVAEAEKLTGEIKSRLDKLADVHDEVMPLIREAIERGAYRSLGYESHGDYVSQRFGGSLARLGIEGRQDVVVELTKAGLSSGAIAPIVGVSSETVRKDLKASEAKGLASLPDKVTTRNGRVRARKATPDPELVAKRQAELEKQRAYDEQRRAAKKAEEAEFDAVSKANIEARGGAMAAAKTKKVQAVQERTGTALSEAIKALTRVLNDPDLDVDAWRADKALPPEFRIEAKREKLSRLLLDLRDKMLDLRDEAKQQNLPA